MPSKRVGISADFPRIAHGEALNAFQRLQPEAAGELDELPVVISMRNLIVHEYFTIDARTLIQTAHNDVPALQTKLETLLKSLD
ncbi:HepT-like ribonuclease domain-containing protein [Nesterenkonia alba]|uniref:HepT-like ribonuclease domain-containing protein n=1 Tax=Nesterenkonia alba TaxID=515814 RepID=UPI00146AF43D|nr:HepT-like ribonuclease domain-containing protein [Nesterenkonia alba]